MGHIPLNVSGILYKGWFPFAVPEVAEDGLPFEQWDGVTVFDDGSKSYPSKSSTQKISVFGDGSLYCIPMTIAQAAEWYWKVKKVQSKVRFSTLAKVVTNQGSITQTEIPNLNGSYGYRSWVAADQVMDRSSSGTRNEYQLMIGSAFNSGIMNYYPTNTNVSFTNYEGWGQAITNPASGGQDLSLLIDYFQFVNFADFICQKSSAGKTFWLNPLQFRVHWILFGSSDFGSYGTSITHERSIDQSSIISPDGHITSVPVTLKLSQQTLSANYFQVFNINGDGILNGGTGVSLTDPAGMTINIVPAEYYTYGGVFNSTTGLLTGA